MPHNDATSEVQAETRESIPSPQSADQLAASKFDLGIALTLHSWQALTISVSNHWGGGNSAEKRDWFAGAISDLFASTAPSDMDADYLEEFLLQVMFDEFEVNVDDGSGFEVAEDIMRLRKKCGEGDFAEVDELERRWRERKGRGTGDPMVGKIVVREEIEEGQEAEDDDEEYDSLDLESSDDDNAMDVDRNHQRSKKEKPPLDVDEEGFTMVRRK